MNDRDFLLKIWNLCGNGQKRLMKMEQNLLFNRHEK